MYFCIRHNIFSMIFISLLTVCGEKYPKISLSMYEIDFKSIESFILLGDFSFQPGRWYTLVIFVKRHELFVSEIEETFKLRSINLASRMLTDQRHELFIFG